MKTELRNLLDDESTLLLDVLVHDVCSKIASGINNSGAEAQAEFLLTNGMSEEEIIAALCDESRESEL